MIKPTEQQVKDARAFMGCFSDTMDEDEEHHEICEEFLNYSGSIHGCDALAEVFARREAAVRDECAKRIARFCGCLNRDEGCEFCQVAHEMREFR